MIYLDNAATTQIDPDVIDKVTSVMKQCFYNPSSLYSYGGMARHEINTARKQVAQALGANADEVIFTSGGTEGNNISLYQALGGHAVVSAAEHESVLNAAKSFCGSVSLVNPNKNGIISPDDIERAIRPNTKIISVQCVNNETGVVQQVDKIAQIAKARKILFHCDCVQAFGKIPLNVKELGADLVTVSSHKIYGPKGIGALYFSTKQLRPLLTGGKQEFTLRGGTENVPGIAGFGLAAKKAVEQLRENAANELSLRNAFEEKLKLGGVNIKIMGESTKRAPGISCLMLDTQGAFLLSKLDLMGIQVSSGAACLKAGAPSHVITGMGYTDNEAKNTIRVSFGKYNTLSDAKLCADAIISVLKAL